MRRRFALILVAGLAVGGTAWAQAGDPMAARLSEGVGGIEAGAYATDAGGSNGGHQFVLLPYGDKYLLRFSDGRRRSFVLTVERAGLGTRLLKYDTGATALRISIWDALTLYTQDAPGRGARHPPGRRGRRCPCPRLRRRPQRGHA